MSPPREPAAGSASAVPPDGAGTGRYAFLRTPHWLRVIAVGVLVAVACAALGYWQWNRHTARLAAVERVDANYDAAPVALADVLPEPAEPLPAADAWRPVTTTGSYAVGGTVLLRNRPVAGSPAHHVLATLVVPTRNGGSAVLVVDRGWVPAGSEEAAAPPAAPEGAVEVVLRLRPAEPAADRPAPPGQVYAVAPAEVLALTEVPPDVRSLPVLDAYGVLAAEEPPPAEGPLRLPRPDTDLGTHLSYTFQWWVFALGALVGVAVLARREAAARAAMATDVPAAGTRPAESAAGRTEEAAPGAPGRRTAASSTRPPRRRTARGDEEEDALIDAQLRRAAGDAGAGRPSVPRG